MSFETHMTLGPIDVPSANGTALLRIVPQRNGQVRVEPTKAGRTLNSFWSVWLRQLILDKTDLEDGFVVDLRDNDMLVSSQLTHPGLVATVLNFAVQIRPLAKSPMIRQLARKYEVSWRANDWDFELDEAACRRINELNLPARHRVEAGIHHIWLTRSKRSKVSIFLSARLIELHLALYYDEQSRVSQ